MEIQNLTELELDGMIAKSLGWSPCPCGKSRCWMGSEDDLPRFSTSLDACATFEATITNRDHYCGELIVVIGSETPKSCLPDQFTRITATPRQRCIAFLRMKGVL